MTLWRGEDLVRLPPKAFDTLIVLARHRGEVVTKQQLLDAVWPGTFVEESNLAQNIFLLRRKLGQAPDGNQYIETLSKRGYRIRVPVEAIEGSTTELSPETTQPEASETEAAGFGPSSRTYGRLLIGAVLAAMTLGVLLISRLRHDHGSAAVVPEFVQITHDTKDKRGRTGTFGGPDAALLTDGSRLYFTSGTSTAPSIWQVSTKGGEPAQITVPFTFPQLLDYSAARSELLVAGAMDTVTSRPLWSIPVPAGTPRRLTDISARDASWSPDGREIAFTNDTALYLASERGTDIRKIADLPNVGWRPRWSPDGKTVRLTIYDVASDTQYLWQVSRDGSNARRLFEGWNRPSSECCGVWSPNGKTFLFQATREGKTEVWSVEEKSALGAFNAGFSVPKQVSGGQLNSLAPSFSPDGKTLYVIGQQLRGELQHFDSKSGEFVPFLGGMSADSVEFSRDGQWLLYVAYPEGTLWRARSDGSNRLQLTFAPMQAMIPHWSPDGKTILFHRLGGGRDEIDTIPARGGEASPIAQDSGTRIMNESWSPDGYSIAYSDFPFFGGNPSKVKVHLLDLKTKRITDIPDSEGNFAPVWSPDGRYLAASTVAKSRLLLFDFGTKRWSDVAEGWDFKTWSRDSRYLFFMRHGSDPAIMKMRISDRKVEEVASLKNFNQTGRLAGLEFSLDLDDSPMLLKDTGTQEIYSLNWKER